MTPGTVLAQRLRELLSRAEGSAPDAQWMTDLREATKLATGLEPYLEAMTSPQTPALADLADRTAQTDWNGPAGNGSVHQEMLSGHVEGQFLKTLVRIADARRVLEVGMFTGYASLAMAEELPSDGRLIALEIDPGVAEIARRAFAHTPTGERIEVRVGPAQHALAELGAAGDQFDLIFVDADKGGYQQYYEQILSGGLLAPRGLLAVDNTLMQGDPWTGARTDNGRAIAQFNNTVAADPRVHQVLVPLRDGITLIRLADHRAVDDA